LIVVSDHSWWSIEREMSLNVKNRSISSWPQQQSMFDISSTTAVGCCVAITLLYVLSLYIWRHGSRLDRQDAETIRKRFVSVGISCVLSTVVIRLVWTGSELVLERD
jgi:hypothetical protein